MHIVVVKQGQDHLELSSGVETKLKQQKTNQGKTITRSRLATHCLFPTYGYLGTDANGG